MSDNARFASEWIQAWNAHDLEAILEHYDESIVFTSPFVQQWGDQNDGTLKGKAALRLYFDSALKRFDNLHFELISVFSGAQSVVLYYRSVSGLFCAETTLDPSEWESARALGHRVIDDAIDFLAGARERPVWSPIPEACKAVFREPLPTQPMSAELVYESFRKNILPYSTGNIHPRILCLGTGDGDRHRRPGRSAGLRHEPQRHHWGSQPHVCGWTGDRLVQGDAGLSGDSRRIISQRCDNGQFDRPYSGPVQSAGTPQRTGGIRDAGPHGSVWQFRNTCLREQGCAGIRLGSGRVLHTPGGRALSNPAK